MNKIGIAIVGSIAVAMGIFAFVMVTPFSSEGENNKDIFLPSGQKVGTWEAQTETRGAIEVSVQPENLSDDENVEWTFIVSFDTHSEEINDDIVNTSVLRDSNGKEYAPREWKGDPPGGHHRSGILSFPAVIPRPDSVSLIMKRQGEERERSFTWNIKGR